MYVNSLKIENLRCFREAEIVLKHPGNSPNLKFPNINLLLGDNGSGKSSVLKALALATLAPVLKGGSGLTLYRMVRNTSPAQKKLDDAELFAEVELHAQDLQEKSKKEIEPKKFEMNSRIRRLGHIEELEYIERENSEVPFGIYEDDKPAFLVVGYGVTRKVEDSVKAAIFERGRSRRLRYQRVASLFEDNYGLIPLQSWLPEMETKNPGRYKQVVNLIDRVSPDDMGFRGKFHEDEFYFDFRETEMPFGALSDGYRHFIGWIADLLYHICMGCPSGKKLVDNKGLVLVDEIDLLLHPEWQRNVLQTLSEMLPNLQFAFTTHSPIVASSVEHENIYVMENDADGSAIIKQYNERTYGLSAEQILLSSYFGLTTTRPKSFVEQELQPLSEKAIAGDHQATIEFMEKISSPADSVLPESFSGSPQTAATKVSRDKFKKLMQTYKDDVKRKK